MLSNNLRLAGVILIVLTGLIHFYEVPGHLMEEPSLGYMFIMNGVGSLVAAFGIYRKRVWGWILGLFVAFGAICGYIISRTIGMPGMEMVEEVNSIGVAAVVIEALFTLASISVLFGMWKARGAAASSGENSL